MTAQALARTHAAAFTDQRPWSAAEFESFLSQPHVILCGDAKSFVLGRVIGDEAEVLTLATHPDFQRKGMAKAQLAAFLAEASDKGAARVFLEVADTNFAAKTLYIRNKFNVVGHRSRYYDGKDGTKIGADVMEYLF